MRSRSVLVWLLGTAAATTVAWAAVAQVTARTVEPLPAGIAQDAPAENSPTVTGTEPAASPTSPAVAAPTASPSPTPDPPPAASETRSYQLAGGDVTIAFSSRSVEVVSVTPRPGYTIKDVNRHGPLDVEVELRAEDTRSRVRAWWDQGAQQRIDEDR